jgi:D-lactate dehydrogenase
MKITFTELDAGERRFFEEALGDHELRLVDALAEVPPDTEILSTFIASRIDEDFLAAHPALRLVATRSTTTDHIDLESCGRHAVTVCDVASYGDHIVAEHTFALLLALTRRLREAMHLNGQTRFSYERLRGTELRGKTFGILGAGRVGMKTIPVARAFGMEVIAHDIAPRPAEAAALGFSYVSFDELLRRSQILSLHTPITGDTFHILDRAAFAKCRRGVLIINTARGRLIDTAALLDALDAGIVGGAGLDVLGEEAALRRQASHLISDQIIDRLHGEEAGIAPERSRQIDKLIRIEKLLARPDVVFTPHIAFNCLESIARINVATVANIKRFIKGRPRNIVPAHEVKRQTSVQPSDELCLAANI